MDEPSLFPLLNRPQSQVSDEVFNLFHAMDRELYTRLVNMGRDPGESIQVMAFWMWLEREAIDMSFIKRLLTLPLVLLNEIADEAIICLSCVENDRFSIGDDQITLLPDFFSSPVFDLRFLHQNRIAVVRGVTKIINTVCTRAFNDILQRAWNENANAFPQQIGYAPQPFRWNNAGGSRPTSPFVGSFHEVGESSREAERRSEGGRGSGAPQRVQAYHPHPPFETPYVPHPPGGVFHNPAPRPQGFLPGSHHHHQPPPQPLQPVAEAIGFPTYDFVAQRQMLTDELGEMLSRNLVISSMNESEINPNYNGGEIPPDDRTIFLTFSKGYPISEAEVRDFFTRRFGDFIEALIMQEVGEDEQSLYARMVVRSPEVISRIVGQNKAKYSINGKHVWARKYMKKQSQNNNQQLRISASASTS